MPELLRHCAPGQGGKLALEGSGQRCEPFQVERAIARHPEHLLVQSRAQALGGGLQLGLVELQGDGFTEQGTEFAIQAVEQPGARGEQGLQGFELAVLYGGLLREQLAGVACRVGKGFALLVHLELVKADLGDALGELVIRARLRQSAALFIQDAGQQGAALQDVDLFGDHAAAAVEGVQALTGVELALGEVGELLGAAQQVGRQGVIDRSLARQHAAGRSCTEFGA